MKKLLTVILTALLCLSLVTKFDSRKTEAYGAAYNGYWVGMVRSATDVGFVSAVSSFDAGVQLMNSLNSTNTSVACVFYVDTIVAARYATLDFSTIGSPWVNSYMDPVEDNGQISSRYSENYFNGYYGSEGPYVLTGSTASRAMTFISGLRSSVLRVRGSYTQYEIVPISVRQPMNYYTVHNGSMIHYFYAAEAGGQTSLPIGVAPDFFEPNVRYYSADQHYFYTDYKVMIDDLNADIRTHAVNSVPWVNYYQFLPFHSTTNYTAEEIDNYLTQIGYTNYAYSYRPAGNASVLVGSGSYFMQMQQVYGVNPLLMMCIAVNESGWGRSAIAVSYLNIFGMAAYDSNPDYAKRYSSILDSINDAGVVLSEDYLVSPINSFYNGSFLGNKEGGVNVFYASDPYWGEKAAAHYYQLDRALGFKDYNYYTIGITNSDTVNTYNPDGTIAEYNFIGFSHKVRYSAVLIVGETGDYYKIMADISLASASDWTDSGFTSQYDFENNFRLVRKSDFTLCNHQDSYEAPKNSAEINKIRIAWLPESFTLKIISPATVYSNAYLTAESGETLAEGSTLTALEHAYNINGETAYKVIVDLATGKTGWIRALDAEDQTLYYAKREFDVGMTWTATVYAQPNTSSTALTTIPYSKESVVILNNQTAGGVIWYQICCNPQTGQTGWVQSGYFSSPVRHIAVARPAPEDPDPEEPPTDPEEPPTDPEDPPTNPEDPPTDPEDPPTDPEDPPTDPEDPGEDSGITDQTKLSNMFYLDSIKTESSGHSIMIRGLLAIEGIDNKPSDTIHYFLQLVNENTSEKVEINLDRWTEGDYPYDPGTIPGVKYDYTGAWFKGSLDFSEVPSGNYRMYLFAYTDQYYTSQILSNTFSLNIAQRFKNEEGTGIELRTDYLLKAMPLELIVREEGLLSDQTKPTKDNAFVEYTTIDLSDTSLYIKGTAFNVQGDYPASSEIQRQLVLENTATFKRYTYEIGSTDRGDYTVTLRVPDGMSKTRAWFAGTIDVSNVEPGNYAIYIVTTSANGLKDYGELTDIFCRTIKNGSSSVSERNYSVALDRAQRFRIEFDVK